MRPTAALCPLRNRALLAAPLFASRAFREFGEEVVKLPLSGVGPRNLVLSYVHVDKSLVSEGDKRLLTTAAGPLNPAAFLSFVRRAVEERWIEHGRMTHADGRGGPRTPPKSDPGDARGRTPAAQPSAPNPQSPLLDPTTNVALPRSGR